MVMAMPVDREGRLSRLTKLLRRSSSSSAKNSLPSTTATSTSSKDTTQHQQQGQQLLLQNSRTQDSTPATAGPAPSTTSLSTSSLIDDNTGPTRVGARRQETRKIVKEDGEQGEADDAEQEPLDPEPGGYDDRDNDQVQIPSPCRSSVATAPCPIVTGASIEPSPQATSEPQSASPTATHQPDEALEERSLRRRFEEYTLQAASREKSFLPRSARPPIPRGSAAAAARPLDVVNETNPGSFSSPPSNTAIRQPVSPSQRPSTTIRRQSLVPSSQHHLINTLLEPSASGAGDYFSSGLPFIQRDMIHRRVWVKRAGSSPTLVAVTEEDLVDDLRDAILKKFANSLGRTFDAPDVVLKLIPREPTGRQGSSEHVLGPEEPVGRMLDNYYPGGQTVEEALIIEVPQRRTPKPSPRQNVAYCHPDDLRVGEPSEYFPPLALIHTPSNVSAPASSTSGPGSHHPTPHSMAVITTGQLPAVPSPGNRASWHQHQHRPKYPRQHTSSPTIITTSPSVNMTDTTNPPLNGASAPPPQGSSTPPAPTSDQPKSVLTPPPRVSSPRPSQKPRKSKKNVSPSGPFPVPTSLLDGAVPPINVLIVEDNIINLKLLEAFMKRLKVRWQTAMNGREAVSKWRDGGFHLVLMDIQLPVMSGLEATKEIRRLERLNGIGVFSKTISGSSSAITTPSASPTGPKCDQTGSSPKPEDILQKRALFKSPVIVVALTASSLQSDRHEALAAGCNDFLTKPVNIVWLEQKVTEWGCMQALIDFEGWRKWRGFANLAKPQTTPAPTTPIHQPPSVHGIANSETASSVAPLQRRSHPNVASGSGSQNDTLDFRDGNPSQGSSRLAGVQGSLGGSGKESSASSSSTVVANGEANVPTATGTVGGRNSTVSGSDSAPGRRMNRNSGGAITPRSVCP